MKRSPASQRSMDSIIQTLLKLGVLVGECRYRLAARTHGSQPWNRGSIPRTGTNLRSEASRRLSTVARSYFQRAKGGPSSLTPSYGWQARQATPTRPTIGELVAV